MDVSMGTTVSVKHLNDFSAFGQTLLPFIKTEFSIGFSHRVPVFSAFLTCALVMGFTCSQPFVFAFSGSLLSEQVMVPFSSSASTASSIDDSSEHNMWNPLY